MITHKELKESIEKIAKNRDLEKVIRSPFINNTFAGDFNYSIGEEPIIRKFGSYLPIRKNWSFSVSQPCIRIPDFHKEVKKNSKSHLLVFEMKDIGGIHLLANSDGKEEKEKCIETAINFIKNILKINQNKLFISYFSGNTLSKLTGNRTIRDKFFPPDKDTCLFLNKLGFSKKQLIPDSTQKNFVLTSFPFEFYAGYRSEIYVKNNKESLLEIGTFEYLGSRTKITKTGKLEDVKDMKGFFCGCAIGTERALMAANSYSDIFYCENIFPLYKNILKLSKRKKVLPARIICEVIRLLQAIIGDGYDYETDRYLKRKLKIKKLIRQLQRAAKSIELDLESNIQQLLELNAQIISYKPERGEYSEKIIKLINEM